MKGIIKSLLSKKLAVVASHKAISIAVATVVVAGAGTGTAVIAYNHNKAAAAPQTQLLTSKTNNSAVNNAASNNTATNTSNAAENSTNAVANNSVQPAAQTATSPATSTTPATDTNQAKYDAAKAKAGSRLAELLTDLKKLGYSVGASDTIDATNYSSILKFQNDSGLEADGLPGSATFAKLNAKLYPASTSSSKVKGASTSTNIVSSGNNGSTPVSSQSSLPSPSELEAKYSDSNRRQQLDYSGEIYSQLDSIWNNFLSNHDVNYGNNAVMNARVASIQNGLYTNIRASRGGCGKAIISSGMSDVQIGDAIGSTQHSCGEYIRFHIVDNGNGTYTVYGMGAEITHD